MWRKDLEWNGRSIRIESGQLARRSSQSVLVREGDSVLLFTLNSSVSAGGSESSFLPLSVDYRELLSAGGRIPGSFNRRESRANDADILVSRLCDRAVRPLFSNIFTQDTQIGITVLSAAARADLPFLAMLGVSVLLHLSPLPWNGPMAPLHVERKNGKLALCGQREDPRRDIDLRLAFTAEGLVMIEGGARECSEADLLGALDFAQQQAQPLLKLLDELRLEHGASKLVFASRERAEWVEGLEGYAMPVLFRVFGLSDRTARAEAWQRESRALLRRFATQKETAEFASALSGQGQQVLNDRRRRYVRERTLLGQRSDGREAKTVRPISCEVGWLPATHGSALFTRGETQAMVSLTLGGSHDRQRLDTLEGTLYEDFILHYTFPPYAVGESRSWRGPGRREVGHGALARRALRPLLPQPLGYTVRLQAEIAQSDGSSSMATVCGGSLALMDGGVALARPVAGIAMGLVQEGEKHIILSDILGEEDGIGDMDCKVAGSSRGLTAIQMDNKRGSLSASVLSETLAQALEGREQILSCMTETIAAPRRARKASAPTHLQMQVDPALLGSVIGQGGKVIQGLQQQFQARIRVEDDGSVLIHSPSRKAAEKARRAIEEIAGPLEIDGLYEGEILSLVPYGAFVRIRGRDGLVHISEWDANPPARLEQHAKVGERVRVRMLPPDANGRLSLSRRLAQPSS